MPEQQAREKIDAQLAACGWVVQDYAAVNFGAGRGNHQDRSPHAN